MKRQKQQLCFTTLDKKGLPVLKNPFYIEKAISKLYSYEILGLTPKEITDMQTTIRNLQNRVKKLEDW